jgi:malate synthase
MTKPVENYEQLIARFTKRKEQLSARQDDLQGWYEEYIKNENALTRLEGSLQAIEYVAFGKMPGDGNHDKFKDHKPQN